MSLSYWLTGAVLVFRALLLGYLLGCGSYDASFFTYINYALLTAGFAALELAMWQRTAFLAWVVLLLPILWGTTMFVAIAIVVIIQLNDGVFLRTTIYNDGTRSVATIHTGDWLLHQLPLIELLLVLFVSRTAMLHCFHVFWRDLARPLYRTLYTIYFVVASLLVLSLYMSNINFSLNYPTSVSQGTVWALTVFLALAVNSLLFVIFFFSKPSELLQLQTPELKPPATNGSLRF